MSAKEKALLHTKLAFKVLDISKHHNGNPGCLSLSNTSWFSLNYACKNVLAIHISNCTAIDITLICVCFLIFHKLHNISEVFYLMWLPYMDS